MRRPFVFPAISRRSVVAHSLVLVAIVLFPLMVPGNLVSVGFVALQYALFALGLNVIVGWTGLLDLGAAGFVAVGAYSAAILLTVFGLSPLAVLPITFAVGFLAGIVLGIPTLRHRLDYFAILTLGFAEMVALGIRNWTPVTGGSFGYSGIPPTNIPLMTEPLRTVPPIGFYYFVACVVVPVFLFVTWLRTTALGRRFHTIKLSEDIGHVYGINVLQTKLIAFGISAAILSAGGFFWAVYQRSIIWTEFNVLLSCLLLSLLVVGGMGNPKGVMLGAVIVGSSLELIRRFLTAAGLPQNIRFLIFAVALVVVIHLRPSGLLPDRPRWLVNLRPESQAPDESRSVRQPDPDSSPVLEVNHVTKSFGNVSALDRFSITIGRTECVALIGPNGSGKTTLVNMISGLMRPDDGEILLEGHRIDNLPSFRIARSGIGRSFQDLSVYDDLTAEDNVYLTAENVCPAEVRSALCAFGIQDGGTSCELLPYGTKKSLDLARLFVAPHRLKLVLLDEPTAGLTHAESLAVVESLAELRNRTHLALLVISHDVMFLEALNINRMVVMNRGRVFKEGSFSSIRADQEVQQLFWGAGPVYE